MEKLKCNLCDAEMDYLEYKGTHIWVCEDCPNIQFEFYTYEDVKNLEDYIQRK